MSEKELREELDYLRAENAVLKKVRSLGSSQKEKELKRVTMERDILKEATTVFFAGESKKNKRS